MKKHREHRRVVIPGGAGFLGSLLSKYLVAKGYEVVVLTRSPDATFGGRRDVRWDGKTLGPWTAAIDGAYAVINLTGRSVDCRYNKKNRQEIFDSRILSTRIIGEAIVLCDNPPTVWLNASTATIYKHTYGEPHDESSGEIGATKEGQDKFSIEVATAWETEFERAETPSTRKVALRTAIVFGNHSGTALAVFRRLTRFGLGGKMGHGRQYVSWIHGHDFCRAVEWILDHKTDKTVYNLCAPNPVTNRQMMTTLRNVVGAPFGLPATGWMLEIGAFLLRTETVLILKSRRVLPGHLHSEGFSFEYPVFEQAIRALEADLGSQSLIASTGTA